ncbi:hypothetical protein ACIQC9_00640 [Brevundimonas sp. NPDC092305]|uniref:hypothetical protein n=1 Tax=Brevundimonas sp. NPDC092305 TaxID=3363957 RepID=UPI0037FE65D6
MSKNAELSGAGRLDCGDAIAKVTYVIALGSGQGAVAEGRLRGNVRDLVSALGGGPRILTLEGGGVLRVQVTRLGPASGEAQFVVLDAPA